MYVCACAPVRVCATVCVRDTVCVRVCDTVCVRVCVRVRVQSASAHGDRKDSGPVDMAVKASVGGADQHQHQPTTFG